MGNPWIFENLTNFFNNKEQIVVSNDEKLNIILEHIDLEVQEKGELVGIKEMRKHLACYLKKLKDASRIREKVNKIDNKNELEACLIEYFGNL